MKKIDTHIAMTLMAVFTMAALTSCESDEHIAYDLNGEWQGYMGESYYDYWGYENYAEYYTVMSFYRHGSSSYTYGATTGSGEQIDYINGNRYRPIYRRFTWEVDWNIIYIRYETGERAHIANFDINGRYFTGKMRFYNRYGEEVGEANFDFRKATDFNWNQYYNWSQQPNELVGDSIVVEK